MGIFDNIKSAIFGSGKPKEAAPAAPSEPARPATDVPDAGTAAPAAGAPLSPVDVEAVLTNRAAQKSQRLDWRNSIVDLMKVLDLDSSLGARKELARELNYTGDTNDSASMNIWLHKQVMIMLAASGGKVPDELRK